MHFIFKQAVLSFCLSLLLVSARAQQVNAAAPFKQQFVNADIDNFWIAYDKVTATKDSALQYSYLKEFYLDKGTEGLSSLLQVRNYTVKDFISAINSYPKFWQSLRQNSLNIKTLYAQIETDIEKLKKLYPSLQPSVIYFLTGAFRTGGTILKNRVLIGCELSLGDATTVIDEFPGYRQNFYKENKPKENIALLCTHEYIHTQQKEPVDNLLSYCIYEGVAEFISCLATGKKSNTPAIYFGKANQQKVVNKFLEDMYFGNTFSWLWGENDNELKIRDLGYYIGYEICERYYNLAADKAKAVKDLIELDFTNEKEVERIVDQVKLFPGTLAQMWDEYNKQRPFVTNVKPFTAKKKKIKPGLLQISITFSQEMDTNFRGFDYGPLGADYIYEFKRVIGWSNQNKTFTLEVEVKPGKKYQTMISSRFRNKKGIRVKQFLIDFETKGE
jgi:hypothetical protein